MAGDNTCPSCGVALPRDAVVGNCPRCLMQLAVLGARLPKPAIRFFGDYELIEEIAHGGMGVVFRARHLPSNQLVALKMILAGHLAAPSLVERFRGEAEATARLGHPNIVPIREVGAHDGQYYYSMKLIEGRNLAQEMARRTIPIQQGVKLMAAVADAVHHAHQRGILHRDLKPTNILLDQQFHPLVSDFGLAKILEEDAGVTQTLATLGTPSYMAPEQAAGRSKQVTAAADVYSLGAVFYELLTGRPPFRAETPLATMRQVTDREPTRPALLNPLIPRDLEVICLQCLQKEPHRRYASALAFAEDLRRFLAGTPVCARPVSIPQKLRRWCRRRPALAALLFLLVAVVLASVTSVVRQWRLAEASARREAQQRARAEQLATRLTIEKAETLFRQDAASEALAQLAWILRQSPTNVLVASRLISALGQRNFCLPIAALRHTEEINCARFSHDGRRILTASDDHTARLWDGANGKLVLEVRQDGPIRWAEFSPDGRWLVTASQDRTARVWDAVTGQPIGPALTHEAEIRHAEFSPSGRLLITSSSDHTAVLWELPGSRRIGTPWLHGSNVVSAHFSPDGTRVVTACRDKLIRVWEVSTGRLLVDNIRNRWIADEVQFTPTGSQLLVGSADLFDARTGQFLGRRFEAHTPRIYSARFSPDGRLAVTASADATARIYELASGLPLGPALQHDSRVYYADFSPDGQSVLTCAKGRGVRVWQVSSGQPLTEPLWHDADVRYAEFSTDGHRLLTQPAGAIVWLWDLRQFQPLTLCFPHREAVRTAAFTRDGKRLLTASWDHTAVIWDVATGRPAVKPLVHRDWISSAVFSPDEQWVVTASHDTTARVWDSATGALRARLPHQDVVRWAEFSPDSQWVTTASDDGTAQVWDARTGKPRHAAWPHGGPVQTARFSPDGRYVLTASTDGTARVWDAESGQPSGSALHHGAAVQNACFSPDSRYIVTAAIDHSARVWNAATGQLVAGPIRHDDDLDLLSPRVSPDGTRALTTARNGARIWELLSGQASTDPMTHLGRITSAQFDRSGARVATTSQDHTARVWDAATGLPLTEALAHSNAVISAAFSPDNQWLVTTSYEWLARIWELPPLADPVPAWLADLAEAVAGRRINPRRLFESVSGEELLALSTRLRQARETAPSTRWAKWFLADSATRSISLTSSLSVEAYAQRLLDSPNPASLRLAVQLFPTNGVAFARLTACLLQSTNRAGDILRDADWFSRRAVAMAPDEEESWTSRAHALERGGALSNAVDVLAQATQRLPGNATLWDAYGTASDTVGRKEEAIRAFSRAIELAGSSSDGETRRTAALLHRAEAFGRQGRVPEARADFRLAKKIPERDPALPPLLINLDLHYNAGLGENWRGLYEHDDLSSLLPGRHTCDEIEFDVRGLVQLSGRWLQRQGRGFPERIEQIKVNQTCRQLHFLHAAGYAPGASNGVVIARYTVHYANGIQQQIPIIYGQDVLRHWTRASNSQTNNGPRLAWQVLNVTNRVASELSPSLYHTSWSNPWPNLVIETLDLNSAMTDLDPFVVAITTEPLGQP